MAKVLGYVSKTRLQALRAVARALASCDSAAEARAVVGRMLATEQARAPAKKRTRDLTAERARELLSYDPETGLFHWRQQRLGVRSLGRPAGRNGGSYVRLMVDGTEQLAHRLAWLYVTGDWPTGVIDHKDGNRHNNRFANLRNATRAQNNYNMKRPDGRVLPRGVMENRFGRFVARMTQGGQYRYLGTYDTAEEAHRAYCVAAVRERGEFARLT